MSIYTLIDGTSASRPARASPICATLNIARIGS